MEEDDIQEIDPITPRSLVLGVREFLLTWDGCGDFFLTGTAKIGGVLHAETAQAEQENRLSLNGKLQSLGKKVASPIKQAISQALNNIKRDIRKPNNTDSLETLIKKYMKEALAKIEKISGEDMFVAYQTLCNIEVIYDLLTSELHRLDPVIGDLGCQWRTPFVLDLHDAIHNELRAVYGDGYTNAVQLAITGYEAVRSRFLHTTNIVIQCDKSGMVQPSKRDKPVYTSKKVAPLCYTMLALEQSLENEAPMFYAVLNIIQYFLRDNWLVAELPRPAFDPLEYIRLCKLLTANRTRTLDEFGLSGIQSDYDVPDSKRTLSPCLEVLSDYSMAYMTYVCEESCTLAELTINDEGYAVDPENEDCIHIVGSALKLMKDARFWTHQRSGFYKTNVCYGPTRAIFTRQAQIGHPIIIDLRRLICTPDDTVEGGYRYTYNGGAILYFEPDNNGRFRYVDGTALSDEQKAKVGLVCEACSMVLVGGTQPNEDDPDYIFCTQGFNAYLEAVLDNCDIVDLIMYGLSSHPELTSQICTGDNTDHVLTRDEAEQCVVEKYLEATGLNIMPVMEPESWSLINDQIPFPDGTRPESDLLTEKANFLSICLTSAPMGQTSGIA